MVLQTVTKRPFIFKTCLSCFLLHNLELSYQQAHFQGTEIG